MNPARARFLTPANLPPGPWHTHGNEVWAGGVPIAVCQADVAALVAELPELLTSTTESADPQPCAECAELKQRNTELGQRNRMLHDTLQTFLAALSNLTPAQKKRVPSLAKLLVTLKRAAK